MLLSIHELRLSKVNYLCSQNCFKRGRQIECLSIDVVHSQRALPGIDSHSSSDKLVRASPGDLFSRDPMF